MTRVKCFDEVLDRTKLYTMMDAGLRVIEVNRIVGTVGKCGELDSHFRYIKRRDRAERSRRYRLTQAAQNYQFLPPIDVYHYQGGYYVVDGNRRVSTAKSMGIEFIDAHVVEYFDKGNANALTGSLLRRRFEKETGLRNIKLNNEIGYGVLLKEVTSYPEGDNFYQKARNWYSQVFLPGCSQIDRSELLKWYNGLLSGDIFILITNFYKDFMGGVPGGASFQTLISGFMFAHKIPKRRIFHSFPLKVLLRIFIFGPRRRVSLPSM